MQKALINTLSLLLLGRGVSVSAQAVPYALQSVGFNSSFTLSQAQIDNAQITNDTTANINTILQFERSQYANGGPAEDDFYTLPPLTNTSGPLAPGTLLKTQDFTNLTSFTLPPNTALSRILYTSTDLNGTVVPTSAFILWPFQPRQFPTTTSTTSSSASNSTNTTKAPTILWTHGTSGFFQPQAPSSHRSLWYADAAPFPLALAGYAVVAPDYAGLGVSTSWDGSDIPHQYLASPTAAQDALNALRAARAAFPDRLTEEYVAMGHSQGGGVAWGVAEAVAAGGGEDEKTGHGSAAAAAAAAAAGRYLGAIAGSPTTRLFSADPNLILPWVSVGMRAVFPDFEARAEWLTDLGAARLALQAETQASFTVGMQLYSGTGEQIVHDDWEDSWYTAAYAALSDVGHRAFAGPLLVVQGTQDLYIPYDVTTDTVAAVCDDDGTLAGDLEYLVLEGVGHVPALEAARPVWMQWIEDRFMGRETGDKSAAAGTSTPLGDGGCRRTDVKSWLPYEQYLAYGNSFIQWSGAEEYAYQAPLGL